MDKYCKEGLYFNIIIIWEDWKDFPINQGMCLQENRLYVAKCNLGKVKIEPMLVAGLSLTGVGGFPPKHTWHGAGWSQGLKVPSLRWRGTFLVFELISADQFACVWANLCGFKLPALPSIQKFQTFLLSMGSGKYFSTDLVSVWRCQLAAAYRGGSRSWGCHGYLTALAWRAQAPCQPLRHQFPSSSIGDEFKN